MKTVLRREFLTTFEAVIAKVKKNAAGDNVEWAQKAVNTALGRVFKTVFPIEPLRARKHG